MHYVGFNTDNESIKPLKFYTMRLKNLLLLLLALPLAFVACEETNTPEQPATEATVVLTSDDVVEFTAEGGAGTITYRVENGEALPKATCKATWVTNLNVAETITFTVAANDGAERVANIKVTLGKSEFEVIVRQQAANDDTIRFNAKMLVGEYYGDYYSPNVGNYYIHLTDNGFDENGEVLPNSTYYCIDLFGPMEQGSNGYINVPVGEYFFDDASSMAMGTFTGDYSATWKTDASGELYDAYYFQSGKFVVTENGMTLTIADTEGNVHVVTYEGSTAIYDYSTPSGETTTLTTNYACAYYAGDAYSPGVADSYTLYLSDIGFDEYGYELPDGTYFMFDLFTEMTNGTPEIPQGTYHLDVNETGEPWTCGAYYSGYYVMDSYGENAVEAGTFADGTITVGASGIVANMTIMQAGECTVTFTGKVEVIDIRSEISTMSARVAKAAHKQSKMR